MAPKRKGGSEEPNAREKKRQKVVAARAIAVQPVKSVSFAEPTAGSSKEVTTNKGLRGLPGAIDVEKFTEARAFEINAMQDAMKNASGSSISRAWQALPRHLRRRSASHDVRRVPLRLREKSRAEMDPVKRKILGRSIPKLGKARRLKRTEIFLKRQRDKLWLETHLWHAKRMKMENMWGYRLALSPTEKAFRPSHRASIHGSILHDASYYSLIELKGQQNVVKAILEACCDPQGFGPGSRGYITGSRAFNTHFYEHGSYPFKLIGPITIIWKPQVPTRSGQASSTEDKASSKGEIPVVQNKPPRRKRKGKGKEPVLPGKHLDPDEPRVVWLSVHPSTFDEVFSGIQSAASVILDNFRRGNGGEKKEIEIELADLRGQINTFEIMGPKSNQVLRGALCPIPQDRRVDFQKFWHSLGDWQTSGELSRGMIISVEVYDPRLKFPPRNAKPSTSHEAPGMSVQPSPELAASDIWDEAVRSRLAKPRFKKKDLDERRSKLLVPGTPLQPLRLDDRIPLLLIQRSLEDVGSPNQGIHGWTLMVPAGWSMAFFSSLTFTGTRVGGQRERQVQGFEAGTAYFPRDLPLSKGYQMYAAAREEEAKVRWSRKPPAKRPNFEKLGTRSPWRADWEVILGLRSPQLIAPGDNFVTTQREENAETSLAGGTVEPWLLRGSEVAIIMANLSKMLSPAAGLLEEMNKLRMKRGHDPFPPSVKAEELFKSALISVRVKMQSRGVPNDLAMIYAAKDDDEARQWCKTPVTTVDFGPELEDEVPSEIPASSEIVGYITTGHFSLSQGQGSGVGAISLVKLLEIMEQWRRISPNSMQKKTRGAVKVRNGNSQTCRPAFIELLDS